MAQRPDSLAGGPADEVDVLSDILRNVRLTGAVYYRVSTSSPWPAIWVPLGRSLIGAFGPRTGNVVSYHVILEGRCWAGLEHGPSLPLEAGDIVVFPRGDPYFLSCRLPPRRSESDEDLVGLLRGVSSGQAPASFAFGDAVDRTTFVCGFLGTGPTALDPVLAGLPPMLHVRGDERLRRVVDLSLTEIEASPGSASVRERLSESMFLETLRQYLASAGEGCSVPAVRDPIVARALAVIREDIGRDWTLVELSTTVGVSRSVLAQRFTGAVGCPPMKYVAQARIRLACDLLEQTPATVDSIAHQVGYASEAALSRAFKRLTGRAPSAWRANPGGVVVGPDPSTTTQ